MTSESSTSHLLRLDCPTCGAGFRLRHVTPGKAYHCPHCRGSLATAEVAGLVCDQCGWQTIARRVDLAKIHPCRQCNAPLRIAALDTLPGLAAPRGERHEEPVAAMAEPYAAAPSPPRGTGPASVAPVVPASAPDPRFDDVLVRLNQLLRQTAPPSAQDEPFRSLLERLDAIQAATAQNREQEQRLDTLSQQFHQLAQFLSRPDPRLDELRTTVEGLSSKPVAADPRLDHLRAEVAALAARLDADHAPEPPPHSPRGELRLLEERLNARLDQAADRAATDALKDAAERIDRQVAELPALASRLDAMSRQTADWVGRFDIMALAKPVTDEIGQVLEQVKAFREAVDNDPRPDLLARRLADLTARTDATRTALEDRLSSLPESFPKADLAPLEAGIADLGRALDGLSGELLKPIQSLADIPERTVKLLDERLDRLDASANALMNAPAPEMAAPDPALLSSMRSVEASLGSHDARFAETTAACAELAAALATARQEQQNGNQGILADLRELRESVARLGQAAVTPPAATGEASPPPPAATEAANPVSAVAPENNSAEWAAQWRGELARAEEASRGALAELLNERLDTLLAAVESLDPSARSAQPAVATPPASPAKATPGAIPPAWATVFAEVSGRLEAVAERLSGETAERSSSWQALSGRMDETLSRLAPAQETAAAGAARIERVEKTLESLLASFKAQEASGGQIDNRLAAAVAGLDDATGKTRAVAEALDRDATAWRAAWLAPEHAADFARDMSRQLLPGLAESLAARIPGEVAEIRAELDYTLARAASEETLTSWAGRGGWLRRLVPGWAFIAVTLPLVAIVGWLLLAPRPAPAPADDPELKAMVSGLTRAFDIQTAETRERASRDDNERLAAIETAMVDLSDRGWEHFHIAARLAERLRSLREYTARQNALLKNYQETLDESLLRHKALEQYIRTLESSTAPSAPPPTPQPSEPPPAAPVRPSAAPIPEPDPSALFPSEPFSSPATAIPASLAAGHLPPPPEPRPRPEANTSPAPATNIDRTPPARPATPPPVTPASFRLPPVPSSPSPPASATPAAPPASPVGSASPDTVPPPSATGAAPSVPATESSAAADAAVPWWPAPPEPPTPTAIPLPPLPSPGTL